MGLRSDNWDLSVQRKGVGQIDVQQEVRQRNDSDDPVPVVSSYDGGKSDGKEDQGGRETDECKGLGGLDQCGPYECHEEDYSERYAFPLAHSESGEAEIPDFELHHSEGSVTGN